MAITFVNKGAFNSSGNAITVALPASIAAGDLLLLFVQTSNQSISTPAGWTADASTNNIGTFAAAAAGATQLSIFYRIATGSDSAPTTSDSGDHQCGIILAYRGVHKTNPFDAATVTSNALSQSTSGTTTLTYPTITTRGPNRLIVLAAALGLDSASTTTTSGYTNANLSSLTEQHDQTIATGTGGGFALADGTLATAGAAGTTTGTTTTCTKVCATLALRPGAPALSLPGATSIGSTSATPQVTVTL